MDIREAIAELKMIRDIFIHERCVAEEESEDVTNEFEIAFSAMEKQIPKKPKDNPLGSLYCKCPNCFCSLLFEDNDFTKYDYCSECGQAIDWSES